jgi:hypothetical protein
MPKNKGAIVAIHGVGTPAVGDIITDLSVLTKNTFYTRSDVVSQGTKFAAQTCEDASSPDLFEVNWSDIKRPPRSIMGVAEWIVSLSFAFSHANLSWTGIRLLTGRVHPIMFEAIFLWVIYPVLLGLMHANLSSYALVVADSAVIGIAVLTLRVTWKTTIVARTGGIIAVIGLALLAIILSIWPAKQELVNTVAVRTYGWAQIVAVVLLALVAIEVTIRGVFRQITPSGALARLAFAYLPIAMLSALGSLLWGITLNIVVRLRNPSELDPKWQALFVSNLGYDLKRVEWAMAGATALMGLYAVFVTLLYIFAKAENQGRVAHKAIFVALILTPLLLGVPGTLIVLTSPLSGRFLASAPWQDILAVYKLSALRLLPWLAVAVTRVAVFLDVLADVAFYITDPTVSFSSVKLCNGRLALILEYVTSRYEWVRIVAHSQGTVIAQQVLLEHSDDRPIALTTMGSPLATLYEKYLGWKIKSLPTWENLFRWGDYIGGPVGLPNVDRSIGPGGHTGYWKDLGISEYIWKRPEGSGV